MLKFREALPAAAGSCILVAAVLQRLQSLEPLQPLLPLRQERPAVSLTLNVS